ncbi:MAG: Pesticidal crystal protein cry22Aa [Candidatus Hydrogenedentes bacterium ADurb.Bin170]|nr:MAG: Pesticidal crystal protein cry22Aa [Candidatus Hydrogenedentes bacterium ADurb.Bin170]
MRTPILLVVLTALFCIGLLGIVGYTQAQSEPLEGYTLALNGAPNQRYTVGDVYFEAGLSIHPPLDDAEKKVKVSLFILPSLNAAHTTYLAYIGSEFNEKGFNQKAAKYELRYSLGSSSVVRQFCYASLAGARIALLGDAEMTVECGTSFIDPGAAADDECDGDLTSQIIAAGNVNTKSPGEYTRLYSVTNSQGNKTEVTRKITVVDTLKPALQLLGREIINIPLNGTFTDPGATASDSCDGDLTGSILVDDSELNPSEAGDYSVRYSVQDSAGNVAEAVRTVRVGCVSPGPVIELNGDAVMEAECGEIFADPGVQAWDECEEDEINDTVEYTDDGSFASTGTVRRTYKVTNYMGLQAQVTRTITVVDTKAPVITLNGKETVSLLVGDNYTESGADAFDACEGAVSVSVEGVDAVDTSVIGRYFVTYRASDSLGNEAVKTRLIRVGCGTPGPVIELNGDAVMEAECGEIFADPGATATNEIGTVEYPVTATKLPKEALSVPGEYVIIYSATNELGNTLDVARKVIVVDTKKPVIVLRGAAEVIVDEGSVYVDPGVLSALDDCDGDLRKDVLFESDVDTSAVGVYHVEFFVRDSSGNRAMAVRTAQVRKAVAPGEGENEGEVVEGEPDTEGEDPVTEGEDVDPDDECPGCGCRHGGIIGDLFMAGLSLAFIFFMIFIHEKI